MNIRKLITIAIATLVAGVLLIYLWNYFTSAELEVRAGKDSEITVASTKSNDDPKIYKQKYKKRVAAGTYKVTATSPTSEYEKVISLKANKNISITVPSSETKPYKLVATHAARGVSYLFNQLFFIDNDSDRLMKFDSQNVDPTALNPSMGAIYFSKWADSKNGIFLTNESDKNAAWVFNNGVLSQINLPLEGNISSASIDTTGKFALSIDKNIFIYSSLQSSPKKMSSPFASPVIDISHDSIIISELPAGSHDSADTKAGSLIKSLTGASEKKLDVSMIETSFNPSGDKLALVDENEARILNSKHETLSNLPKDAKYLHWIDDNRLVYTKGSDIWLQDINQGYSILLVNTPLNTPVTSIGGSSDSVFLSTNDDNLSSIYQVSLNGSVESRIVDLQKVLPVNEESVQVELYQLGPPRIVIRVPDSPDPAFIQKQKDEGLRILQDTGIDIKGIPIVYADLERS